MPPFCFIHRVYAYLVPKNIMLNYMNYFFQEKEIVLLFGYPLLFETEKIYREKGD
jgi:hypothetical protein